ncbi:hypothetical protein RYX36_013499 [Vicia faba]
MLHSYCCFYISGMGGSPKKGGHGSNFTWIRLLNIYVPSSYRALISSSFHRSAFIDLVITNHQIQQAVIDVNIIPPLVVLVQNSEFDIKKGAARAISNATLGGSHEQLKYGEILIFAMFLSIFIGFTTFLFQDIINYFSFVDQILVNQGCIKPLCDLLICPDPRIVTVCLEGLENILKI